jgi:hypothetical protein
MILCSGLSHLVVPFDFLNIVGEVDEPLAPLLQALVALAEVLLKLLEEGVQLGHVLCDRGQGQGQDCQNEEMFERHPLRSV